jgi:hypothetical protein
MKKPQNTRNTRKKKVKAKPFVEFNINGFVRVRLTAHGRQIVRARYDALGNSYGKKVPFAFELPKEDSDGFSTWQMHELISVFGPRMASITLPIPFDTTIRINRDELVLF